MATQIEKTRITEIKVRMDCNGCVQKIKKALNSIVGINDLYVDFPQQKITIIGWVDPENIVRAIKKTRKTVVICLHIEQSDQPMEPPLEGSTSNGVAPSDESPTPPVEPPNMESEAPKEPLLPENPLNEVKSSPELANAMTNQSVKLPQPKDEEIHVIYRYPPNPGYKYVNDHNVHDGYGGQSNGYPNNPRFQGEPYQSYPGNPGSQEEPSQLPKGYFGNSGFRRQPSQPPQPYLGNPGFRREYPRNPGFRDEASQPLQEYSGNLGFRREPSQAPQLYPDNTRFRAEPSRPTEPYFRNSGFRMEPSPPARPVYVNHSYNTYKPTPYVTEYAYPRPLPSYYSNYTGPDNFSQESQDYNYSTYKPQPYMTEFASPRPQPVYYSQYSRPENYGQEYYSGNHGNSNITSIFSEENPNACTIV